MALGAEVQVSKQSKALTSVRPPTTAGCRRWCAEQPATTARAVDGDVDYSRMPPPRGRCGEGGGGAKEEGVRGGVHELGVEQKRF